MPRTDTESVSSSSVSLRDLTELRKELEGKISDNKVDFDKKIADTKTDIGGKANKDAFNVGFYGLLIAGVAVIGVLFYQIWDMGKLLGGYETRIAVLEKQLQDSTSRKTP